MKKVPFFYVCAVLFTLFFHSITQARVLHIIHTNDLHSYFMGYRDGKGGYARLMSKIRELRKESYDKGIEVLQLDAGDFGEGTAFFLSDEGSASIKALEMLGAEVSVIGNHDHMMGGKILGQQIRRANVKTKFLSANLVMTPDMELNDGIITPYVDLVKNNISIRVIGLSTAEAHYQYPLIPGFILPPVPVGSAQADAAKKAGKELVIALTHIGQDSDVALAKGSTSFNLIVGGHSHDRIEKVRYENNKNGKPTPIVQAGSHGLVVGSLMVDVQDNGELKILNYKLHEIKEDLTEEPNMAHFVAVAADNRNHYFNGRWDEIIGESKVPLNGYVNGKAVVEASCWGEHMAKMTQEAVGADIGIHLATFDGVSAPPGPVRFGDLVDNFPHFRKYGDFGWEISTFKVSGKVLKYLLRGMIQIKDTFGIDFWGVRYHTIHFNSKIPVIGGKDWIFGFRINGRAIRNKQMYTLAIPAEVGFALKAMLPAAVQLVFPGLENTGKFYWNVMEDYVRSNSPIECLSN